MGKDKGSVKEVFLCAEAAVGCTVIEKHHTAPHVPFDRLLETDIPEDLRQAIAELLEAKKRTVEGERNPQMPVIREFIERETERQKEIADHLEDDHNRDFTALKRAFIDTITENYTASNCLGKF